MRYVIFLMLWLLMLQIVASTAVAQSSYNASIKITIVNVNNEILLNAKARLANKNQNIELLPSSTGTALTFQNLKPGEYLLDVEVSGYKSLSKKIKINAGQNTLTIQMELVDIIENVEVKRDKESSLLDNAFVGFFTREQIDALPDTAEEIERELKRRYGPDVIIRVDGFSDRIPDKSKIASIKATQTSYDAENHELGFSYVDITTKVSEESFGGSVGYDFNNQSLNARPTLGKFKLPQIKNNFSFNFFGPIKQKRTAFDLFVFQLNNITKSNIIAVLPDNKISEYISASNRSIYFDTSIYHNLTESHNLKVKYSLQKSLSSNLGVGGFDLPQRAYANKIDVQKISLSDSGYFNNKYFNEFRLFYQKTKKEITPDFDLPTIQVLDAFNSGGAGNSSDNSEQLFWISDNFLFGYKNHALKIGGIVEFQSAKELSLVNEKGTFIFSSINNFINNQPSIFKRTPNPRSSNIAQLKMGVFIQDDFKIRNNLGLSLGLRYESQNSLSDFSNFSPRLGFTWIPSKLGDTVVRGGVGIFYNWLELSTLRYISNRSISQPNEITIINPTYPLITANNVSEILPPSFWQLARDAKNPVIFHSSVGINTNLSKNFQLQINYVFQKGTKMFRTTDINPPTNGLRLNSEYSNIYQVESSGFFVRNALDANFSTVLKKGITFSLNYTLQKKISDSDDIFSFPSNNSNLNADRASSNDDQRHRISGNISWKIKRGLLLTAVYRIDSPLPYTIITGFDDNNDTIFNDRPYGVSRNSERGIWKRQLDIGASYTFSFYNLEKERKGNATLIFSGSEITRDNETIGRNKRFLTKFYISAFNIFNSSNFNGFVGVQTSPLFRQPISANTSRRIEIGLRLGF